MLTTRMLTTKSMMIDGVYLESLVDGLTIIDVSGRESLSASLKGVTVEDRNGAIYNGKTYGARSITVSFAIVSRTRDEINEKLDSLNSFLDREGVQVVFRDESDRYYNVSAFSNAGVGVSRYIGSDKYLASGSFECYCADPFKYSLVEYEAEQFIDPETGYPNFIVDYNGTYKSHPIFKTFFYDATGSNIENDKSDVYSDLASSFSSVAYKKVELAPEDFNPGVYYILDAELAKSYSDKMDYYSLVDDETVKAYILTSIGETDITEATGVDYYNIGTYLANVYDSTKEYYIVDYSFVEDPEAITDIYPSMPSSSGDANEKDGDSGACGYVALIDSDEHVLQFGNPEYNPDASTETSELVISNNFQSSESYNSSVQALWDKNYSSPSYLTKIDPNRVLNTNATFGEALVKNQTYAKLSSSQTVFDSQLYGIKYTIAVTAVNTRKPTSVQLSFSVKCTLKEATLPAKTKKNGKGTSLVLYVSRGGTDLFSFTMCKTSAAWTKGKTVSYTKQITISELLSDDRDVSGFKMRVEGSGYKASHYALSNRAMTTVNIPIYTPMPNDSYYLKPVNTLGIANKVYGPSLSRMIVDKSGQYGAKNFKMDVLGRFCIGADSTDMIEKGILGIYLLGGTISGTKLSNEYIVMGLEIRKETDHAKNATVSVFVDGKSTYSKTDAFVTYDDEQEFSLTMEKGLSSGDGSDISISFKTAKTSDSTGSICSIEPQRLVNVSLSDEKVYRVVVAYFDKANNPPIAWCGIKNINFIKYGDSSVVDNVFHSGQTLEVDCSKGDIFVDGVSKQKFGALGNDWEDLCLKPGLNQLEAVYSDWVKTSNEYIQATTNTVFDPSITYYTKSGTTYTEVDISETMFIAQPTNYYYKKTYSPKFKLTYREVFI